MKYKDKTTFVSKSKPKEILTIVAILLLGAVLGLYVNQIMKEHSSKLYTFKKDIINNYYRPEVLDTIFKNNLGDNYTGDVDADFDIFVITSLYNEINKYELKHNRINNSYFPKERLDEYHSSNEENAKKISGASINNNTYYINITQFRDGVTYKLFSQHKDDLVNFNNLIIDLRNNTGGGFDDFTKISNFFLEEGSEIYRLNTSKNTIIEKSTNKNPALFENIVILTNNYTASASELFILSLKANLDNVTLIGTNTYGKNISCSIRTFKDKTGAAFITSHMAGPNGAEIASPEGIAPDIYVGNTEDFYKSINDPDKEKDLREKDSNEQYECAVQFLTN